MCLSSCFFLICVTCAACSTAWDAKLRDYEAVLTALRDLVDGEMKKTGREYVLVGRSNHERKFSKGAESNDDFMLAMIKVTRRVFSDDGNDDDDDDDDGGTGRGGDGGEGGGGAGKQSPRRRLFFYDWRAVSESAKAAGEWKRADELHQDDAASTLQIEAFTRWSSRALPDGFAVRLPRR